MKKALIICFLFFYVVNTYAQRTDFSLKGHITGLKEGTVFMRYRAYNQAYLIDSSKIVNGNFEFSGQVSQPVIANISLTKKIEMGTLASYIFLEPALMALELTNNPLSVTSLKGSKTYNELMIYKNADNTLKQKFISVLNSSEKSIDPIILKKHQDSLVLYSDQKHAVEYDFIKNHPKSYIIPELLVTHNRYYTTKELTEIYNNMGPELQENPGVKFLFANISKVTDNSNTNLINITGKDFITDVDFSLASLKGKYVLLDFWGSWCQPCLKLLPDLVEETKKYKEKNIAFVSICYDSDINQNKCKTIVKKLGMNWINIWSSMDKKDLNSIQNSYNVGVYPTYILIDPNGKIVDRFDSEYGYYKCKNVLTTILLK